MAGPVKSKLNQSNSLVFDSSLVAGLKLGTPHIPPTHTAQPASPSNLPHHEPSSTEQEALRHKKQIHFEPQPQAHSDLPIPVPAVQPSLPPSHPTPLQQP